MAVGISKFSYRAMTSEDGTNWIGRASAPISSWNSVSYVNGVFVAVGNTAIQVMTSPDGITWTSRTSAAGLNWSSVTYGNGLFVAVSGTNSRTGAMTSGQLFRNSSDPSLWTNYYQALPLPESGTCADITQEQNTFAAHGTNVTGGWVKGWEPWVNSGTCGWACRRNLVNTGGDTWNVTN